jgi:hypothetical protein
MSVLETCKRAGHAALDFISQALRPLRQSGAGTTYPP